MSTTPSSPFLPVARASGRPSGGLILVVVALVGLGLVWATDQIAPTSSAHLAQIRIWLASRAAGITAYLLLTFQVLAGLVLSHPNNKAAWKLSKGLYNWHAEGWIFVLAFLVVHIVTIILDPYAGVGVAGAFIPGLSSYRSVPVALGSIALYALLITGMSARYTKLLPQGSWLKIHRLALGVWGLAWIHGVTSGSDTGALLPIYGVSAALVVVFAAWRYWIVRLPARARANAQIQQRPVPAAVLTVTTSEVSS